MKISLPNKHDAIFKEETNPIDGAWLKNPASKFFLYSEGYKQAGQELINFCRENKFYNNRLVYPIVFCYRQYLELKIKELTLMGYKYLDLKGDFEDDHSLIRLWRIYREIILQIEEADIDLLNNVERIICQINDEDPKSMSFRYPVSKGPNREQSLKRATLDLKNFETVMDKLIYFFDMQWDTISNSQDLKDEMLHDLYQSYL